MNQHLISTRAQPASCPGCGTRLLTALDRGIPTRVDATPINPESEVNALLENRWTYTRTQNRELIHRDPGHIRSGWPPGTIHAQHKCATPTLI